MIVDYKAMPKAPIQTRRGATKTCITDNVKILTMSPGATTSGFIRPSKVGPKELKYAMISISWTPSVL